MVFQSYALYPHMTVAENLSFSLKLRGQSRAEIERRVRASAEVLGLTELLQRRPRQLSGGQRQRVALGRALVRDPEVFLLDEPLSNLDAKLRLGVRTEIAKLHRSEEHTSEPSHDQISYAVFCLKKKKLIDTSLLHHLPIARSSKLLPCTSHRYSSPYWRIWSL